MKKLGDAPQIKGMIEGSKISLVFLLALVIFGNHVQFSIILALVAGGSYGLLVAWWHGKDEPPAQPLLRTFEQVIPRKKGRNNINLARDERKKQKQIQADQAKARAEKLEKAKQQRQQPSPPPDDSQQSPANDNDSDQN
jgi:hypothetical protein